MVLINLTDVQPQRLIDRAGVMADNKRGIFADIQTLAELADIATGIAGGEGRCSNPVPGHVMHYIGELVCIDQDLPRNLPARGPCMAGNKIS